MTTVPIPLSFDALVHEVKSFSALPEQEVRERMWLELLEPGSNVVEDVGRFSVTPHRFDDRMEALYRESDSFVFETLAYWAKPRRQRWTKQALDRARRHAESTGSRREELKILMLGDGAGNDSICFANEGFRVDYFDVPGSKTFDFAMRRFEHYGLLGDRIRLRSDYRSCLRNEYDVVVSFEVLEHLERPVDAIGDIRRMLRTGGIALVTEAFGSIRPDLPTHLASNAKYDGVTPLLFLRSGMVLGWYSRDPLFKPLEFVAVERAAWRALPRLVGDRAVVNRWATGRLRRSEQGMRKLARSVVR